MKLVLIKNPVKHWVHEKTSVLDLTVFRFLYCLFIACELYLSKSYFSSVVSDALKCGRLEVLYLFPILSHETLTFVIPYLINVLILFLILSSLGILYRLSLFVCLVLSIYLFANFISCSAGPNLVYIPWNHSIVIFNIFILLISPRTSSLSLRSFLEFDRTKIKEKVDAWPVYLIKFNLIFSYFASVFIKLGNGFEWMNGHTMQYYFFNRFLTTGSQLALNLGSSIELMKFISVVTIGLELTIPIVFFIPRLAGPYILLTLVLQLSCYLILDLRWMSFYGWSYLIYLKLLIRVR